MQKILNFAGWSWIGSLAFLGRAQGAALLLNFFFGTVINAAFAIANQINQILQMFSQSVGQAVIPQIIQSYSAGDLVRSMRLVCYANKYSFMLMFMPAAFLFLEMDYFLKLWLDEAPVLTSIFCRLMIIVALIDCVSTSGITAFIQAHGDIRAFQIGMAFSMLMSLPVSGICLYFGAPAYIVLAVQSLMSFLGLVVRLILLKYKYRFDLRLLMNISLGKIIFLPTVFIAPVLVRHSFSSDISIYRLANTFLVYFISYLCICCLLLDKLERGILKQKIMALGDRVWK